MNPTPCMPARTPFVLALAGLACALCACRPVPTAGEPTLRRPGAPPASALTVTPDRAPPDLAPTAEPALTPLPSATATPALALNSQRIWVGVDGRADVVVEVGLDGAVRPVALPLEVGQTASNVTAAADRHTLAYLVWGADGRQLGAAVWPLDEAEANLLARPGDGTRIAALALASDGSAVAYTELEDGAPLEEAGWAIFTAAASEGTAVQIVSRAVLPGAPPLAPFAWPAGGPVLLSPLVPGAGAQGVYAVDPATGSGRLLLPVEGELGGTPVLAPGGRRLAYLALQADPPEERRTVLRVHDLRLGETLDVESPPGHTIYGARWLPDGERLLLDVVVEAGADGEPAGQAWAVVRPGEPWETSPPGPEREGLFDYAPLGEGVLYTTLPSGSGWTLTIVPELARDGTAQTIALDELAQASGAPFIIHMPTQ